MWFINSCNFGLFFCAKNWRCAESDVYLYVNKKHRYYQLMNYCYGKNFDKNFSYGKRANRNDVC